MANSTELRLDLANLIKLNSAGTRITQISLYYELSEVTWTLPPQAQLGSSTVRSIWIGGTQYSSVAAWTAAWTRTASDNQRRGLPVQKGRPPSVSAVNIATAEGRRLAESAVITEVTATATGTETTNTVLATAAALVQGPKGDTGPQGPKGDTGPQGLPGTNGVNGVNGVDGEPGANGQDGMGIRTLAVNESGNLLVTLDDSSQIDAGYVVGPVPSFAVGTVTVAATPAVSVTGGPLDYVLNFELQAGPPGPGSGDVSTASLYADPPWITSLAASKVGLGNVTNESKATMFTDAALTGTPTAPTAVSATNSTQIATTEFVKTALQAMYPVGSIYINAATATNPATLLGFGTWTEFGAGRVMVGLNSSDTIFDTLEETGGSKDAIVVSHGHTATSTVTDPGHSHTISGGLTDLDQGLVGGGRSSVAQTLSTNTNTTGISVSTTVNSNGSSGTNANLQPYIVVRMWKRTA